MKKSVITIIIVGIILTIMAFSNSERKSEGALGDVKYSILPPEQFRQENGGGWALMDDKIPIDNSDLKLKLGILELPDARGMFIRGLQLTRKDGDGDVDGGLGRLAGSKQPGTSFSYNGADGNPSGGHARDAVPGSGVSYLHNHTGIETRPKNIALYIYIKINE